MFNPINSSMDITQLIFFLKTKCFLSKIRNDVVYINHTPTWVDVLVTVMKQEKEK